MANGVTKNTPGLTQASSGLKHIFGDLLPKVDNHVTKTHNPDRKDDGKDSLAVTNKYFVPLLQKGAKAAEATSGDKENDDLKATGEFMLNALDDMEKATMSVSAHSSSD